MNSIIDALKSLPDEIAQDSISIVNLMNEKLLVERKLDEIQVAVNLQITTDPQYKNDGARKNAIKDILAQNKDYEQYIITIDRIKYNLDIATISHQRKRDMFYAYIAIAKVQ